MIFNKISLKKILLLKIACKYIDFVIRINQNYLCLIKEWYDYKLKWDPENYGIF